MGASAWKAFWVTLPIFGKVEKNSSGVLSILLCEQCCTTNHIHGIMSEAELLLSGRSQSTVAMTTAFARETFSCISEHPAAGSLCAASSLWRSQMSPWHLLSPRYTALAEVNTGSGCGQTSGMLSIALDVSERLLALVREGGGGLPVQQQCLKF